MKAMACCLDVFAGARENIACSVVLAALASAVTAPITPAHAAVANGNIAYEKLLSATTHNIFELDMTNGTSKGLTDTTAADSDPSWSPNGGMLAFSSNREGDRELYVLNPDASITRLTYRAGIDEEPTWSPDCRYIAYRSYAAETSSYDIFYIPSGGGSPINLSNSTGVTETAPEWSPVDSRITYASNHDGDYEVYVLNSDGSVTQLTDNSYDDTSPNWSPDGSMIAYRSILPGNNNEIFTVPSGGSTAVNITNTPSNEMAPKWAPDGSMIAFVYIATGTLELRTMKPDGSGTETVARDFISTDFSWRPIKDIDPCASSPPSSSTSKLELTRPRLSTSNRRRVSRGWLYNMLRTGGFKGTISGYVKLEGSLVRRRSKKTRKGKRVIFCESLMGRRAKCGRPSTKGVKVETPTSSGESSFAYRPLGYGAKLRRSLTKLKRGKRLARGGYILSLRATDANGQTTTYEYRLKVV